MSERRRGSALVETAGLVLLASVLVPASIFLGRLSLRVHRSQAMARYGAALAAMGAPAAVVDAELHSYSFRMGDGGAFRWTISRYLERPSARFYRLRQAWVETSVAPARVLRLPVVRVGSSAVVEEERG